MKGKKKEDKVFSEDPNKINPDIVVQQEMQDPKSLNVEDFLDASYEVYKSALRK